NVGGDKPFAHIQDLQAKALAGYDAHSSISVLLRIVEQSLAQTQIFLDFRKPDLAYVEYLRASEIIINIVPGHRDQVDFLHDQRGGHRNTVLIKKVKQWEEQFAGIKNIIINNNKRNGVQPNGFITRPSAQDGKTNSRAQSEEDMRAPVPYSNANAPSRTSISGIEKIKPSVSPKPDRLHGRMISNAASGTNGGSVNLVDRFAKLRVGAGGGNSIGDFIPGSKDSISSSPITMPSIGDHQQTNRASMDSLSRMRSGPQGPRDMPGNSNPPYPISLPLDTQLAAAMPKQPSPTYSPARNMNIQGNITAPRHSARSLASTERRTISSASYAAPNGFDQSSDYFPSANGNSNAQPERAHLPRRRSVHVPVETRISNERLYDYIPRYNILVIDVRSREQFDEGHIWARNIICIDPLSLRQNMSADEVLESLVLSPDSEQDMFLNRDQFDLVVYYDKNTQSENFLTTPQNESQSKLKYLHEALYDYNHEKPLQRPPILLIGGVEAWIDLVGSQGLMSGQTTSRIKPSRPISRQPIAKANGTNSQLRVPKRRLRDYNPLDAEEEAKWRERARAESVAEPQTSIAALTEEPDDYDEESEDQSQHDTSDIDPSDAIRDFVERFPEAGNLAQASRIGMNRTGGRDQPPPPPAKVPNYPPPPPPSAYTQAPARPAPAAPRMSYTGVSERSVSQTQPLVRTASGFAPYLPPKHLLHATPLPKTGLINFGVTCYMNATLQALSATTPLSLFFQSDHFRSQVQRENWKGSKGVMPELYANVIRSLWKNDVSAIKPSTFRTFCGRLNREWSIDRQQDAKEFFDFLVDCLHEDLNSKWDKHPLRALTEEEEARRERMPKAVVSCTEWGRYTHRELSYLTHLFGGQHASRLRCTTCGHTSTTYEAFYSISVEIPHDRPATLEECLKSYCSEELLTKDEVWKCPNCKKEREASKQITITRVPQFLVIHFKRFSASHHQSARKIRSPINFPLYNLDLMPYCLPPPSGDETKQIMSRPEMRQDLSSMTPPYLYDCYAVVRHIGGTLASGHYTTAVKDRSKRCWRMFNDTNVRDFQPKDLSRANELQNEEAYIVFYQRTTGNATPS
ncbi:cysteine proteinase, partial [Polychaeton citri CBS 116435]